MGDPAASVGSSGGEQRAVRAESDGGDATSRHGVHAAVPREPAAAGLRLGDERQRSRVNHHHATVAETRRE